MTKTSKKLNRVIGLFHGKCKDKKAKEYRSFSAMRRADKRYTIQLMFGYDKSKNPIYSTSVEFHSFDTFIKVQTILESGLDIEVVQDNLFDDIEAEEEF